METKYTHENHHSNGAWDSARLEWISVVANCDVMCFVVVAVVVVAFLASNRWAFSWALVACLHELVLINRRFPLAYSCLDRFFSSLFLFCFWFDAAALFFCFSVCVHFFFVVGHLCNVCNLILLACFFCRLDDNFIIGFRLSLVFFFLSCFISALDASLCIQNRLNY